MSVLKVTRAQPCVSRAVAAQSGGSPAATASTCAWAGRLKSAAVTTPGSWSRCRGHGELLVADRLGEHGADD
jgi:hypothetical protein